MGGRAASARYEEMTNLPRRCASELAAELPISTLTPSSAARARSTAPRRRCSTTADGRPIEAVLMSYRDGRRSLCLSSQSGCPLTCTFCATGRMAFGRNLTRLRDPRPGASLPPREPVNHVVFMGMGEPLMNLDAVLAACERLPDDRHLDRPTRRSRPSAGSPASSASPTRGRGSAWRSRCTPPRTTLRSG